MVSTFVLQWYQRTDIAFAKRNIANIIKLKIKQNTKFLDNNFLKFLLSNEL